MPGLTPISECPPTEHLPDGPTHVTTWAPHHTLSLGGSSESESANGQEHQLVDTTEPCIILIFCRECALLSYLPSIHCRGAATEISRQHAASTGSARPRPEAADTRAEMWTPSWSAIWLLIPTKTGFQWTYYNLLYSPTEQLIPPIEKKFYKISYERSAALY